MSRVSVIVPVYQGEPFLRKCLDSILAQTLTDIEVICVDDGSIDVSPAILDEYAAKDPRFSVIKRDHSNAGAARNAGMDLARGEFLSFLDSDDVFEPRMLEVMLGAIEGHRADIATCEIVRFRDGDEIPRLNKRASRRASREFHRPASEQDIFSLWVGRAWDKLFRRSFIAREGLRFQEIRSTNDACFTYSALSLAETVVSVPETMIAYRQSASSLERTRHLSASCAGEAIRAYASEMNKRGVFRDFPSLERHFKHWAANVLLWNMDTIDTPDGFERAHSVFSDICEQFGLLSVAEEWKHAGNVNGLRLERICSGSSPMESLLLHRSINRRELETLSALRGLDRTYAYRIGRIATWIPRTLRRYWRSFRTGNHCN